MLKMVSPSKTFCGGQGEGHPADAEIGHSGSLCKTHAEGCLHGWRSPFPLEHQAARVGPEGAGCSLTPSPESTSLYPVTGFYQTLVLLLTL